MSCPHLILFNLTLSNSMLHHILRFFCIILKAFLPKYAVIRKVWKSRLEFRMALICENTTLKKHQMKCILTCVYAK